MVDAANDVRVGGSQCRLVQDEARQLQNAAPYTFSIGLAPTNRARCRLCKRGVNKGEVRIVTCAFVRPGRRHDFVSHASCATPALVRAILSVYGTVRRVPMASGMDTGVLEGVCERLERLV